MLFTRFRQLSVLPGFNLTLGFTIGYLSLIVLIPLTMAFLRAFGLSWDQFWRVVAAPPVVASYRLIFGAAFLVAAFSTVFSLIIAWVLLLLPAPRC